MKQILILILTTLNFAVVIGQTVKEMSPELGYLVNKSVEGEIEFIKEQKKCDDIWKKSSSLGGYEKLSAAEQNVYDNCSEDIEGYWDILGIGCSWYCGGGPDSVSASSELKGSKGINYTASNAHDLNYKTAWVEGIPGYGIGEYLIYNFRYASPRITKIIVVNGYVKSEKAWRENSRVKKLKMYVDNKPYAILNLVDSKEEQTFSFEPIGNSDRKEGWRELDANPSWSMKFQIMDIYKGDKYDETALTEIYFDGIDVHCFAAGTNIYMADRTQKRIEHIKAGDSILTFSTETNQLIKTQVTQIVTAKHSNLTKLAFEDREVIVTDDHPFYVDGRKWASINPDRSNSFYTHENPVVKLLVGDNIFIPTNNTYLTLKKVEPLKGAQITYTIELSSGDNFIANGLLVKTEKLNKTIANSGL